MTVVYRSGFGKGKFGVKSFGIDGSIFDISMSSATVSSTSSGLRIVLKIGLVASTISSTAPIPATRMRSISASSAQLSSTEISDLEVRPALYLAEMHSETVSTTAARYGRIRGLVAHTSAYAIFNATIRKVWEISAAADTDDWISTEKPPGGIWRPAPPPENWG